MKKYSHFNSGGVDHSWNLNFRKIFGGDQLQVVHKQKVLYEGDNKGESIWDYWYEKEPEKFFNQVGPDTASAFYQKYKEDIQLMKQTGHNSFRTSIQWSRLIPEGVGEVNQKQLIL